MRNVVQELRNQGFQVKVTHLRNFWILDENRRPKLRLFAKFEAPDALRFACEKGGKTIVEVTNPTTGRSLTSEALCGKDESFNKKLAIRIAVGRLLKYLKDNNERI